MATNVTLSSIQRGDTVPFTVNWDDGVSAINMQGKTVVMTFKTSHLEEDADAVLTKTIVYAVDDADAGNGITAFTLEASETALLNPGMTHKYALRVIEPGVVESVETTYMYGDVNVEDA